MLGAAQVPDESMSAANPDADTLGIVIRIIDSPNGNRFWFLEMKWSQRKERKYLKQPQTPNLSDLFHDISNTKAWNFICFFLFICNARHCLAWTRGGNCPKGKYWKCRALGSDG